MAGDGMRLGVVGRLPEPYAAEIARRFPDVQVTDRDLDALVVWELDVAETVRMVEQHPRLGWVHMRWAGVPWACTGWAPSRSWGGSSATPCC